ncbi:HAMP domain-containing histidine kinase, partial [Streptomyces sp. 8K308]|uniref:sensor histidine kinase n=1 Tax=Streptomyces sp. 8K308 TaxID=2530388 RepID=UPI0010533D9E
APPLPEQALAAGERLEELALSAFLTQAAIALAVVTLLAAVLGRWLAGRILRPVRTIEATARRLSADNLSERVPVTAPADELAALATTVNGMLDRVQQGLHSQRLFTANAAHELRTPLATIRTAVDVTLDGRPEPDDLIAMAHDVRDAATRSQRTLDGLLLLARSQAGAGGPGRRVDLADVAADALRAAGCDIAGRALTVLTAERPAPVTGQPVLLERMAGNLIGNAVRHNHEGGRIEVATGTTGDGRSWLRVVNTGPVVDPAMASRLLEPFVRGDGTRLHGETGSGLGLSIVQAVVAAHHGTLRLTPLPEGGLDVTVRLPAADRAAQQRPAAAGAAGGR